MTVHSLEALISYSIKPTSYEVGGHFEIYRNKLKFTKTSTASFDVHNGRQHVHLPSHKPFVWHVHPLKVGFWPSFEDLTTAINLNHKVHLIITPFGVWIIQPLDRNLRLDRHWYNNISTHLEKTTSTEPNWKSIIQPMIVDLIKPNPVLDVAFFDFGMFRGHSNTRNMNFYINEIIQHVMNVLSN